MRLSEEEQSATMSDPSSRLAKAVAAGHRAAPLASEEVVDHLLFKHAVDKPHQPASLEALALPAQRGRRSR